MEKWTPTYVDSLVGVVAVPRRWRLMALLRRASCFRGAINALWVQSNWVLL